MRYHQLTSSYLLRSLLGTAIRAGLGLLALGAVTAAVAQDSSRKDSVLGLHVEQDCASAAASVERLLQRGFKSVSATAFCAESQADFSSVLMLHDGEDRAEQLEVGFAPGGRVWQIRLLTEWRADAVLFTRPSASDLVASLRRRFGQPYLEGAESSMADSSKWSRRRELGWDIAAMEGQDGPEVQQRATKWGWTRRAADLGPRGLTATIFTGKAEGASGLELVAVDHAWDASYSAHLQALQQAVGAREAAKSASFLRAY